MNERAAGNDRLSVVGLVGRSSVGCHDGGAENNGHENAGHVSGV